MKHKVEFKDYYSGKDRYILIDVTGDEVYFDITDFIKHSATEEPAEEVICSFFDDIRTNWDFLFSCESTHIDKRKHKWIDSSLFNVFIQKFAPYNMGAIISQTVQFNKNPFNPT